MYIKTNIKMADYSNTLELFKQLQQNGATDVSALPQQRTDNGPRPQFVTADNLDQLTEAVFGRSQSTDEKNSNDTLLETLKEVVKVKIKDGDIFKIKRFEVKDITVIKDVAREQEDSEEKEYQKELKELEKLEKEDSKMKNNS